MTFASQYDLPLTYRDEVVSKLFASVTAGESCLVVGIGSVGKSNLLRFLLRDDVRRHRLGADADGFLFVYVDANRLLKHTAWGLWELMLHQIAVGRLREEADGQVIGMLESLHERSISRDTRFLALRYLDRAVALVCGKLGRRLVFVLDELDGVCRSLDPSAFAALRALRDDQKYRLVYLLATRRPLNLLRGDPAEIEALQDLLSGNVIWLGPYGRADAEFMLARLQARHGLNLAERVKTELLAATGGHPGICGNLRTACSSLAP